MVKNVIIIIKNFVLFSDESSTIILTYLLILYSNIIMKQQKNV